MNYYRFNVVKKYPEGFSDIVNMFKTLYQARKYADRRQLDEQNGAIFYITDLQGREIEQ